MRRYTVDANALIYFSVGLLPSAAYEQFRRAADGKVALQVPTVALVEAMFVMDRRDEIQGVPVPIDADQAFGVFEELPVDIVDDTHADARELLSHLDVFPSQMHDAMVVANHVTQETDAIITSDEKMADNYPTVWA
jgi:predicted nucleic acid-binding protein